MITVNVSGGSTDNYTHSNLQIGATYTIFIEGASQHFLDKKGAKFNIALGKSREFLKATIVCEYYFFGDWRGKCKIKYS